MAAKIVDGRACESGDEGSGNSRPARWGGAAGRHRRKGQRDIMSMGILPVKRSTPAATYR